LSITGSKNLEVLRERIAGLVPRARIISAHGQMNEKELESIMKAFVAGRYDVLISTVIIENGLDIPNVNTIIVNRADAMGLSQLYQLRGRVGRSSEQAYAFLLTPPTREVAEDSLIRLRALEQYTELGSGFQIAMRDLEIRGAGNLLGTRQHGFIAAVGFELYCRLLQDAVREVKGEKPDTKIPEVKLEIPVEAYIPNDYIADGTARIEVYQELSSIATNDALAELEKTIADRFGPFPESVGALMLLMRIKFAARSLGVTRVSIQTNGTLSLFFEGEADAVRKNIFSLMHSSKTPFNVVDAPPQVVLRGRLSGNGKKEMAQEALGIMSQNPCA